MLAGVGVHQGRRGRRGKRFLGFDDVDGANLERRWYFDLATILGGMTVDEMLDRMSSAELTEWRAWQKVRNDEIEHARRQAAQRQQMGWRRR